jgi:hypothetical protein
MKNFIILVLLGIIAYLLLTSGILQRAVQSPQTLLTPQAQSVPGNANGTPQISVTVYSPYGTGSNQPPSVKSTLAPGREPPLTLLPPTAGAGTLPDVPIFTPPPPTIIVPEVPPTLALPNTPTPTANFTITLEALHDGDTTNASPLLVSGVTIPNAIVSVNDAVGLAAADGRFALTVPLEPGPNVVEIIASKPNGEQAFLIVTVLYQP